jgi:hypothetical protein
MEKKNALVVREILHEAASINWNHVVVELGNT